MSKNLILEELYAVRSQLQAEYGDHLSAYLHSEFERLKAGGHPVAEIKQRTIRSTGAAKSGDLPMEDLSSPRGDRSREMRSSDGSA
jgi:hypothetical protein